MHLSHSTFKFLGTMHVHARIEGLPHDVYAARIPSLACFCMFFLISRAEQVSASCWPGRINLFRAPGTDMRYSHGHGHGHG
jgi:hypothetical protein